MVNAGVQICGCILGCIGGICVLIATFLPEWKINDSNDLDAIFRYEGLWTKCVAYPSGLWQCENYDDFFIDLPNALKIGRLFSCFSILLGFCAFVCSVFGMECSNCLASSKTTKFIIAIASAFLWIAAGTCIGVAASYYGYLVIWNYKQEVPKEVADLGHKYIYGLCLYLGWSGLILCSTAGLLFGCSSRRNNCPWKPQLSTKKQTAQITRLSKPHFNVEYV